ncbi:WAT1-related protein At5g47470-like [Zingiber officinale]|uniref:WAT1-related protein n=1 Tax=Zingiber officinale TaxID=94328 RepID=A0A8J5FWH3_ZINOF|nr:WAT1-related protein At5g47470-like [Zingiber officinale]KAG6497195.1 hypothetical protein ZIOFF_045085 [Zingiber officinale]
MRPLSHMLTNAFIILGLVVTQVSSAAYMVYLSPFLSIGMNPLFFVILVNFFMFEIMLPFAVIFERSKWPARLSWKLIIQISSIALLGATLYQVMVITGMKITSPAIASAMPNLAPGIIFIVAVSLRFERFDINCWFTRLKILGNIVCIGGAVAFSIYQNPSSPPANSVDSGIFGGWFIGCICLFGAVLMNSFATIMQAATLMEFPAPLSLCAFASLLGTIFTAIAQLLIDGKIDVGTSTMNLWDAIRVALLSGVVNSAGLGFITWSVKEKGPVFVCMFNPVQTVASAILTAVVLGQSIGLKSIVAMFLMFCGLYEVLWAKTKEEAAFPQTTEDIQEPLLP